MQKKETSTRSFGDSMKKFFLQSWSSSVVAIVLLVIIFSITTSAFLSQYNLFKPFQNGCRICIHRRRTAYGCSNRWRTLQLVR